VGGIGGQLRQSPLGLGAGAGPDLFSFRSRPSGSSSGAPCSVSFTPRSPPAVASSAALTANGEKAKMETKTTAKMEIFMMQSL
jgi:hypothetical protein